MKVLETLPHLHRTAHLISEPTCANAWWTLRSRFLSVCLSGTGPKFTWKKSWTRKKFITRESNNGCRPYLFKGQRWKGSRSKVTRGQSPRSGSKVKVTINVKEKAGGLTPTSSCFIISFYLRENHYKMHLNILVHLESVQYNTAKPRLKNQGSQHQGKSRKIREKFIFLESQGKSWNFALTEVNYRFSPDLNALFPQTRCLSIFFFREFL